MRPQFSIEAVATRQHGVISRRQLLDAGWHPSRIARELRAQRLLRVHRGVYAVGHRPRTDLARWMAATLACNGVLSHQSAGALHELAVKDRGLTHITARGDLRRPRIHVHRDRLDSADHTTVRGIPVTRIARTLVDLDGVLDDRAFDRLVRDAMFQRRFDDARIKDALLRKRARRLARYLGDDAGTQSELEDLFLRICDRHHLPRPQAQRGTDPRVDFIWHEHRLVVEVDSWKAHGTRHAFQRDRTTTNALQLAGYTVLRYTKDDLTRRQRTVAAQIKGVLYAGKRSSTHSASSGSRRYGRPPTST
jgi:very-short-patch-repair endonuclease